MRPSHAFLSAVLLLLAGMGVAQEKKLKVTELPPAVHKTVQEQLKGAELKALSKETEKGKTVYELETMMNGKSRDLLIDSDGAVLEIEEATTLDAIPAPARAVIEKAAAGGKVKKVETVTRSGHITYEAAIVKAGKSTEVRVGVDGAIVK